MATKSPRAINLARSFIKEIGTQEQVARVVGVKQPSVSRWSRNGLSRLREADLRIRFPYMSVWKEFPPAGVNRSGAEAR
jgi:predicted XRE-type DNA-binding protein